MSLQSVAALASLPPYVLVCFLGSHTSKCPVEGVFIASPTLLVVGKKATVFCRRAQRIARCGHCSLSGAYHVSRPLVKSTCHPLIARPIVGLGVTDSSDSLLNYSHGALSFSREQPIHRGASLGTGQWTLSGAPRLA
jgi:hypothetical protein